MKRTIIRFCIVASLALGLIFSQKGFAGVASTAIRDTTEAVMRKFGKEVAEESAEAVSKRVTEAAAKYGTEGLEAIGKVGPRAFGKITVEAGEHATEAVKLTAKFGEQAVWVISKPRGLAVFVKYGEEAATAVMKHPGIAEGAVERMGVPAARAREFNERMVDFYRTKVGTGMLAFLTDCHPDSSLILSPMMRATLAG